MAIIEIETTAAEDGWIFKVEVKNSTSTTHTVTMSKAVYDRLTKAQITPEECVQKSFEFLLEREPKESILSTFDITVISRYFPEFEEELAKRITGGA